MGKGEGDFFLLEQVSMLSRLAVPSAAAVSFSTCRKRIMNVAHAIYPYASMRKTPNTTLKTVYLY